MAGRPTNKDLRPREYLTEDEVKLLLKTAKKTRRDPTTTCALILIAYRHAFRVSELINLKWHHVNFDNETIQVVRSKNGIDTTQPLGKKETTLLQKLKKRKNKSSYVFISMQNRPFTRSGVQKIVEKLGRDANFQFPIHPHMLRHATGYKLINEGQNLRITQRYLGHRNIQNTEKYTYLNDEAFKNFPSSIWGE